MTSVRRLPRLHLVTDDAVLSAPDFPARAAAVLSAHGGDVAVHVRGHGLPGASVLAIADRLVSVAGPVTVLVNDRIDVALAVAAAGAQLGRRSLPLAEARRLLGPRRWLGYSAHGPAEAVDAVVAGADFIVVGSVWETSSHPGAPAAGVARLRATVAAVAGTAVLAIGGVSPARVAAVLDAGGYGVAVLSGVWLEPDPVAAAAAYLAALRAAERVS